MTTFYAYRRPNRRWGLFATVDSVLKLHDVANGCMAMLGFGDLDDWDLETKNQIGWDWDDVFVIVSKTPLDNDQLNELANSIVEG